MRIASEAALRAKDVCAVELPLAAVLGAEHRRERACRQIEQRAAQKYLTACHSIDEMAIVFDLSGVQQGLQQLWGAGGSRGEGIQGRGRIRRIERALQRIGRDVQKLARYPVVGSGQKSAHLVIPIGERGAADTEQR